MASHSVSAGGEAFSLPATMHSRSGADGPGAASTSGNASYANTMAASLRGGAGTFFGRRTASRSQPAPATPRKSPWWKVDLFRGMVNDLRRRAPYYWSDWKDAWDYRVVPATVYMYFANILPALAFSLDMFTKTNMQYGVNEVLLASVLGAVVFALAACQPLVIVGVTGPITVFNYTVYDIMAPTGTPYLAFMCWIGLWSLVLHWILAATNSCNWLRYVTRFPCDIFGFYVALIYLQKGIQVLERLGLAEGGAAGEASFYLSALIAVLVFGIAWLCGEIGAGTLFNHVIRVFLKDYGTPLTVVFFSGFVHIGRMRSVGLETLPVSDAFVPTAEREWLVRFWDINVGDVFLALPFAVLLTVLFWFDHNVSSLIAQGTEFPLRKPAGFHWDLFLLGLTTGVAGIIGLPFPNGLIPQAPFHTASLCVTELTPDDDETLPATTAEPTTSNPNPHGAKGHLVLRTTHVVEQRFSNLAQGLLTLVTATPPLLIVLHLIPQAVLAGLFFVMGIQALAANGITAKLIFLLREARLTRPSPSSPSFSTESALLRLCRQTGSGDGVESDARRRRKGRIAIWSWVGIELVAFGITFAITQTVAAVGFPVAILLLIPARAVLLPRWFSGEELAALDGPAASPFTMESAGGGGGSSGSGVLDASSTGEEEGVRVEGGVERRKSGEDLAELGESGAAVAGGPSTTRRRPSHAGRDEALPGVEMQRLGVSRRPQSSRSPQ